MSASQHTPTPWVLYEDASGWMIDGQDRKPVCSPASTRGLRSEDEFKANATFIVRACNSHEALVALAERISHLNPNAGEIGEGMLRRIVLEADMALKLAKP